jgi:hypothetical protein
MHVKHSTTGAIPLIFVSIVFGLADISQAGLKMAVLLHLTAE